MDEDFLGHDWEEWKPMDWGMGPPLPRFLGIYWPWYQKESPSEGGYPCPFCGDSFDNKEDLNKHIREQHRIPIPITWG